MSIYFFDIGVPVQVRSPDLDVLEEEDDSAFEVNNPPKRRPSKTLKVVPSPTSTLERKLGGGGGGGGEHVTFKELPKSPSKNKSRTKSEDIQKKGILGVSNTSNTMQFTRSTNNHCCNTVPFQ